VARTIGVIAICSAVLASGVVGCQPATPPPTPPPATRGDTPLMLAAGQEEAVARLPGLVIPREQFLAPLIEGHGLNVLLNVVQLELAKQNAQRRGLTVTDEDVRRERERTLQQAFGDIDAKLQQQIDDALARGDKAGAEKIRNETKVDHEQLLEQLLQQQRVTRPEFDIVLKSRTYLRKMAEQEVKEIPEETIRKMFDAEYGATVRVRHIQSNNAAELETAKRRIDAGESFEKVAKEVSRNARTAPLGGELPRFSLAHTGIPDSFKQVAFMLKEGEVSNIVQSEGAYHLIKLEQKFPPRAVKYEGVRDSLREKAREQVIQGAIGVLQEQLARQTRENLKIDDPVLRDQFSKRLEDYGKQLKDAEKIRQEQERERRSQPQKDPAAPQPSLPVPGNSSGAFAPPTAQPPAPAQPQPTPAAAPKPAGAR
jgi:parvulin-like peptidyl-prolyl isomerase